MYSRQTTRLFTVLALCTACALPLVHAAGADNAESRSTPTPVVSLWDTGTPVGDSFTPGDRSDWNRVPGDLLLLEKDPLKASSDPGYYGREYSFGGDAVAETPTLLAVFRSAKGCVSLYSKQEATGWKKLVDVSPLLPDGASVPISQTEVVRNAGDQIVLQVTFSKPGSRPLVGVFSFDRMGIVEVNPGEEMKRFRLSAPMAYGVVPAFNGDDLIFGGSEQAPSQTVAVPSENVFVGLLAGEAEELVVTWPSGKQRMNLQFEEGQKDLMSSATFDAAGQSFYLAALSAPGIWHREALTPDFLEKDVRIQWKRPFPAKWKTQLLEEELKTTFAFRPFKGTVWRGVAGSYDYPVWFDGEAAFYHLGKKVQPKGESLIYCLEGRDTPATVLTPADIVQQTLGRQAAAGILDFTGRKLRTHHRRGATGVRRACTCGCTEAIQAVFESGEEVSQKEYIQGALEDMIYFVRRHMERINEYQRFADKLLKTIQARKQASPESKPFLDGLEEIVRQIPQECELQKDNMKTLAYADELSNKTIALAAKKDPGNVKAYMQLLKAWRDMGGAQDYVVAKCHTTARNLSQAAGYGCGTLPKAVPFAQEVRAECRQILRNADGYEIWADY